MTRRFFTTATALATAISVAAAPGTAFAQTTWNAVTDFSSHNPSGQWSYGSMSSLGGTFTLLPTYNGSCNTYLQCWTNGRQYVVHNSSNSVDGVTPPDMLNVDPQGGYAVVRWTAPTTGGTFSFNGEFKSLDLFGTNAYILLNSGTPAYFSRTLAGTNTPTGTQTATFDFSKFLSSGSTVDFVTQSQGDYTYRGTGLAASISEQHVTTAPEPSSIALLGSGLIGLVPMIRRRRK